MPFNGSGVFQRVRNWVADATGGIKIRADFHDAEDDGFAQGLTNCITKDGQTIVTQNIPMNSKRITGLADPINPQDAVTKAIADTKLPLAGGTPMTGDITINKNAPTIILNDTSTVASSAAIYGQKSGKNRWLLRLGNDEAETGTGNTGSDFDAVRFADDGATVLGIGFSFDRATGLGTLTGDPTVPLGIATKQYADTAVAPKINRAGDTMNGEFITALGGQSLAGNVDMGTIALRGVNHAGITMAVPGKFFANFGMGEDGKFYMGGLSYGQVLYQFWTKQDFATKPVMLDELDARLAELVTRIEALEGKAP